MSDASPIFADAHPPLIVIGAGGHTRVLLDLLHCLGRQVLCIADHDPALHGSTVDGIAVKGGDEAIFAHAPDTVRLVNGVGSIHLPEARRRVFERFSIEGYRFQTVVHPAATVARSAVLGEGVQIMAGATVQPGVRLGRNVVVNTAASIDHDCAVADHVHVAPGVTLSGHVTIGHTSHLGTGATVIQGIHLGERVMVGAGAVVVRNVESRTAVVGVPARPM